LQAFPYLRAFEAGRLLAQMSGFLVTASFVNTNLPLHIPLA